MSNKRDLRLDQFGISKHRYRELSNFCLQYKEFIAEKNSCYNLSGVAITGMPHSTAVSDPTANKAERAYKLGKNIELIEQTAIEACGELYPYIIKSVSEGIPWEYLLPPIGRRQFYQERRKFFYLLSLKK